MFDRWTGPAIFAAMTLTGAVSAVSTPWQSALSDRSDGLVISDGVVQPALEQAFENALVLRDLSIHAWSALLYGALGQMAEGGVAGRDGWLFTTEEFEFAPGFDIRLDTQMVRIIAARDVLQARGITLVVVMIPDKARIMTDKLHHADRGPAISGRYDAALVQLHAAGVIAPDLRPVLSAADIQPFLRTDTHWAPEGAQAVAQAISEHVSAAVGDASLFTTISTGVTEHRGDLMRYADAGPFTHLSGPLPESIATYDTSGGTQDLFGDTRIPAILVGTSYSANPAWHFEGFLKSAAATDVLNAATEGRGPFQPMEVLLASEMLTEISPDVVIWDIPERYLTLSALKGMEE